MGTAARKARKRAGIPFSKPAKVPTPMEERSYVRAARQREADRLTRNGHGVLSSVARVYQLLWSGRSWAGSAASGDQVK